METLKIDLSETAVLRLREEAALRNEPAEKLASRLLSEQLRFPLPAELDIDDEEADLIQAEVDAVREARSKRFT